MHIPLRRCASGRCSKSCCSTGTRDCTIPHPERLQAVLAARTATPRACPADLMHLLVQPQPAGQAAVELLQGTRVAVMAAGRETREPKPLQQQQRHLGPSRPRSRQPQQADNGVHWRQYRQLRRDLRTRPQVMSEKGIQCLRGWQRQAAEILQGRSEVQRRRHCRPMWLSSTATSSCSGGDGLCRTRRCCARTQCW